MCVGGGVRQPAQYCTGDLSQLHHICRLLACITHHMLRLGPCCSRVFAQVRPIRQVWPCIHAGAVGRVDARDWDGQGPLRGHGGMEAQTGERKHQLYDGHSTTLQPCVVVTPDVMPAPDVTPAEHWKMDLSKQPLPCLVCLLPRSLRSSHLRSSGTCGVCDTPRGSAFCASSWHATGLNPSQGTRHASSTRSGECQCLRLPCMSTAPSQTMKDDCSAARKPRRTSACVDNVGVNNVNVHSAVSQKRVTAWPVPALMW